MVYHNDKIGEGLARKAPLLLPAFSGTALECVVRAGNECAPGTAVSRRHANGGGEGADSIQVPLRPETEDGRRHRGQKGEVPRVRPLVARSPKR